MSIIIKLKVTWINSIKEVVFWSGWGWGEQQHARLRGPRPCCSAAAQCHRHWFHRRGSAHVLSDRNGFGPHQGAARTLAGAKRVWFYDGLRVQTTAQQSKLLTRSKPRRKKNQIPQLLRCELKKKKNIPFRHSISLFRAWKVWELGNKVNYKLVQIGLKNCCHFFFFCFCFVFVAWTFTSLM